MMQRKHIRQNKHNFILLIFITQMYVTDIYNLKFILITGRQRRYEIDSRYYILVQKYLCTRRVLRRNVYR